MATLTELARFHTDLGSSSVSHLQRLVASWNLLADFFTPLTARQVERLYELNEKIGRLRSICDQQSAAIESLTAEADAWLRLMHSGR